MGAAKRLKITDKGRRYIEKEVKEAIKATEREIRQSAEEKLKQPPQPRSLRVIPLPAPRTIRERLHDLFQCQSKSGRVRCEKRRFHSGEHNGTFRLGDPDTGEISQEGSMRW